MNDVGEWQTFVSAPLCQAWPNLSSPDCGLHADYAFIAALHHYSSGTCYDIALTEVLPDWSIETGLSFLSAPASYNHTCTLRLGHDSITLACIPPTLHMQAI